MRPFKIVAVVAFVAGLALLVAGFLQRSDSDPGTTAAGAAPPGPNVQATATHTPTPSPTPRPQDPTPTPVPPTPTPYDGAVSRLILPRFSVDSAIEKIGLTSDNALETPKDPLKTGWYGIYAKPGWGGNSVFSAHVDYYPNIIGPFHKLAQLELNDDVVVVMDDGTQYRYRVVSNLRYSVYDIPMGEIIWPSAKPSDREWITLITCGGQFVASRPGGPGEYLHRDVVVAERYQ